MRPTAHFSYGTPFLLPPYDNRVRENRGEQKLEIAMAWLLALAVSIDGFSAGVSCGLRKLIIPFPSLLVICFSSTAAVTGSMLLGGGAAQFIPIGSVRIFGGGVLLVLGVYVIIQNIVESRREAEPPVDPPRGRRRPKKLSTLLLRPEEADLDQSGILSMKEALLLGLALAADAFGAGFGAALIGSPLLVTVPAVGVTKLLLVPLGVRLGRLVAGGITFKYTSLAGGVMLIFIGIITIF